MYSYIIGSSFSWFLFGVFALPGPCVVKCSALDQCCLREGQLLPPAWPYDADPQLGVCGCGCGEARGFKSLWNQDSHLCLYTGKDCTLRGQDVSYETQSKSVFRSKIKG